MDAAVQKQAGNKETMTVSTSVQYLKGVGPARAEVFGKLGVQTVGDLLEYFPRDWIFAPGPIKIARCGQRPATIIGLVIRRFPGIAGRLFSRPSSAMRRASAGSSGSTAVTCATRSGWAR
jgi:hypothetical protein